MDPKLASKIIESLRQGLPPQQGVEHYSVGGEQLISGIRKFHLANIGDRGLIRFISGAYGSGKTHFFRLLREVAFQSGCLVSNVELNRNEASLDKFEKVFYSIVRNICTPIAFEQAISSEAAPFRLVLQESLSFLTSGKHSPVGELSYENQGKATEVLFSNPGIDIDFKKMTQQFWGTFQAGDSDIGLVEQKRGEILQWFYGEGTISAYRKYEISKIPNKNTAKLMFQSLAAFTRMAGYQGLVILFDEAEQSYSSMRKSSLKDAQNNLLSLINNVENLPGIFLIYATTRDFYDHPKYGIQSYAPLSGRIGQPQDRPPRALDTIWNLGAVETTLADYQSAANKICEIYRTAYPESASHLPAAEQLNQWVADLHQTYPPYAELAFWRVLVKGTVNHLDDHMEGDNIRSTQALYKDVMDELKDA